MKRYLLTIGLLTVLLTGCTVSSIGDFQSRPNAAIQAGRVHEAVVNVVCYFPAGTNCGPNYHQVTGTATLTMFYNCTNGSECVIGVTPTYLWVSFSGSAAFTNIYYACHAVQYGTITYDVYVDGQPADDNTVLFGFRNTTGGTIPYGAQFKVGFTCSGA